MNIHKSQLFWGSPGVPGFWPIPICRKISVALGWFLKNWRRRPIASHVARWGVSTTWDVSDSTHLQYLGEPSLTHQKKRQSMTIPYKTGDLLWIHKCFLHPTGPYRGMERQKSVPGVPPSLDGANHGTLRRQLSGAPVAVAMRCNKHWYINSNCWRWYILIYIYVYIYIILYIYMMVGGLEHGFYFSIYWE